MHTSLQEQIPVVTDAQGAADPLRFAIPHAPSAIFSNLYSRCFAFDGGQPGLPVALSDAFATQVPPDPSVPNKLPVAFVRGQGAAPTSGTLVGGQALVMELR